MKQMNWNAIPSNNGECRCEHKPERELVNYRRLVVTRWPLTVYSTVLTRIDLRRSARICAFGGASGALQLE